MLLRLIVVIHVMLATLTSSPIDWSNYSSSNILHLDMLATYSIKRLKTVFSSQYGRATLDMSVTIKTLKWSRNLPGHHLNGWQLESSCRCWYWLGYESFKYAFLHRWKYLVWNGVWILTPHSIWPILTRGTKDLKTDAHILVFLFLWPTTCMLVV